MQRDSAPTGATELAGKAVGRYVILSRLGGGGMGEVYLAQDSGLKRQVALKRIAPAARANERSRQKLWKEAERASRLNDPCIAAVYDVIEAGGDVYLVMEHVEGETLRERMARPISVADFVSLAVQCASAVAAAHQAGLLHRDLKPENIMLTRSGQVKVLDFGVARELLEENVETQATLESSHMAGTLAYMAPEIIEDKESDARSDVFSLGVVFYEVLAGRHPFRHKGFLATCDAILRETPSALRSRNPKVPPELERIIGKMLEKDPRSRYATAADLAVDLRALARATQPLPTIAPSRSRARRFAPAAVLTLALAAAIAFVAASPAARSRVKALFGIVSVPHQKYLAILQFRPIENDPKAVSFTAGLTDTLTAKLTQLTGDTSLQVVPATEIHTHNITSVEEARGEFGVNLVLDGSLAMSGGLVRVNYALVNPSTRRQLRADSITVPAADPFAAQDRVVESVVEMLELEIGPQQRKALESHGTQVPGAYAVYLQGEGFLRDYDKPENLDSAVSLFQQAVQLDPGFAGAYAGLGRAYWRKYEASNDAQWVQRSREACDRAANLDGKLAAAHLCLGALHTGTGQYDKAVAEYQRALESEPTSDDAYRELAYAYRRLGQPASAEKTYQQAIALRPQYWAGYSWLGAFYYEQARYQDAVAAFRRVVELTPDSIRGYSNLGAALIALGRYPDAVDALGKSLAIRPTAGAYSNLGLAYYLSRRYADAIEPFEQAARLQDKDYRVWRNLGDGYYAIPSRRADAAVAYGHAVSLADAALKINPRNADAMGILGVSQAMLDRKEDALRTLGEALKLTPSNPDLLFLAALVYNHFGYDTQCLEWLAKARAAGFSAPQIRNTPDFDQLHSAPGFQKLFTSD